jgi:hypothetical protein
MVSMAPCLLGVLVLALAALGCESVAGVDITYRMQDASVADVQSADAGGGEEAAAADATVDHGALPTGDGSTDFDAYTTVENGRCTCDTTQGEGCCVPPSSGAPFCARSASECPGIFLACVGADPSGDSACCWNGSGAGAFTAFAASCGSRLTMCQGNSDCGGSGCATVSCSGVTLGVCGTTAMSCP